MYGKLGHGNELGHPAPCRVEALIGKEVEQIACGSRHTVALLRGGEVYCWGTYRGFYSLPPFLPPSLPYLLLLLLSSPIFLFFSFSFRTEGGA